MNMKKKLLIALGTAVMLSCTGCAGMTWEEMKETGAELVQQGEAVHENLRTEAEEMNASVLSGEYE